MGRPDEVNKVIAKQMRSWIIKEVWAQLESVLTDSTPQNLLCLARLYGNLLFYDDQASSPPVMCATCIVQHG